MTSKGPPSRHSHYVTGVLQPLRALLDAPAMRRLGAAVRQGLLVAAVAEGVCARYAALAEELLVSVRKTESSLKRWGRENRQELVSVFWGGVSGACSGARRTCVRLWHAAARCASGCYLFWVWSMAGQWQWRATRVVWAAAVHPGTGPEPQQYSTPGT